jgi:ribonuclease HI
MQDYPSVYPQTPPAVRGFPAAGPDTSPTPGRPPTPPAGGHVLTIHFAGTVEPDPGTGAYGAVVAGFHPSVDQLYGLVPVAAATGDEADWYALREGLDSVVGRLRYVPGGSALTILGHARHVIAHLNGEPNGTLRLVAGRVAALRDECRGLLDKVVAGGCRWSAAGVPPEQNRQAARLSAEAWCATTGKPLPATRALNPLAPHRSDA